MNFAVLFQVKAYPLKKDFHENITQIPETR